MKKSHPEQDIQIAFVGYLAQAGADRMFFFHVPSGVKSSPFIGAILQRMGLIAGIPDLIMVHNGNMFCLEIKNDKPRGRLSPAQMLAMAALREAGAECAVAYGLDDCIAQARAWGLIRRKEMAA